VAPGSRVVSRYLREDGPAAVSRQAGLHHRGLRCTTCIGKLGPARAASSSRAGEQARPDRRQRAPEPQFRARVHQSIKANFLMSHPLVVAFPSRAGWTSMWTRSDSASDVTAAGLSARRLADGGRAERGAGGGAIPRSTGELRRDLSRETPEWRRSPRRRPGLRVGSESTIHPRPPTSRASPPLTNARARARGRWRSSPLVTTDHISPP